MKRLSIIILFSIFYHAISFAQQLIKKSFEIDGVINANNGELMLIMTGDSTFYPPQLRHIKVPVSDGKFSIKEVLPHPMAFQLQYNNKYISQMIIVYTGNQVVKCNIDSVNEMPLINNGTTEEQYIYNTIFKDLSAKRKLLAKERAKLATKYKSGLPDSLKLVFEKSRQLLENENDQTLLRYINENPASFLGLWKTIHLTDFGYEPIFKQIFSHFTDTLKNSYSGKVLATVIKTSSVLVVGNKFPKMKLLDINERNTTDIPFKNNKYILIDFWYSHCGPCIAQFPSLVNTYKKFSNKGFEIVGISTDAVKYRADWKNAITKYGLMWSQYWDRDGQQSTLNSIRAFPTNFLVDHNGVIIRKDISPAQLDEFLKNKL